MEGRAGSEGTVKLLVLTFAIGAVLGLAGMAVWAAVDDDGGGGGGDDVPAQASRLGIAEELKSQDSEPSTSSESPSPASDTRAQRCEEAARALEAPLDAARPALQQWDVHVGAMNKLVVGEITLQQATQFWNRTRLGAQRNVERFRSAWQDVERTGVDCPAPDLMGPAPAPVRACSRLVEAELGVLRAARTSIATWDKHVHHMDMLRMGTLSPDDATRMWLSMWRRGVQELQDYREAARTSIATWDKHVHHMDMLRMGTLSPDDATRMWLSMWRRGVQELQDYREAARAPGMDSTCAGAAG